MSVADRWESNQPAGVWSTWGWNFLSLRPERRHVDLWRREGPQGGAVGLRLQKTEGHGGESIDLWVWEPREEHLDSVCQLYVCVCTGGGVIRSSTNFSWRKTRRALHRNHQELNPPGHISWYLNSNCTGIHTHTDTDTRTHTHAQSFCQVD